MFGAVLQGLVSAVTAKEASGHMQAEIQELINLGPYPFPVCVLLFTMENNEGYYAWAFEPVIEEGGKPIVRPTESPHAGKLNAASLEEIVSRVNAWYDNLFATLGL
jgi:hypothetical protein